MNIAFLAPEFLPDWGETGTYSIEPVKYLTKKHNVHDVTLSRKIDNGSVYYNKRILDVFDNKIHTFTLLPGQAILFFTMPLSSMRVSSNSRKYVKKAAGRPKRCMKK